MYTNLLAGHFDGQYKKINVTHEAHSNIFSQVALFTQSNIPTVRFTDEQRNYIELTASAKRISASFYNGHGPLADLPINYELYDILFGLRAIYTAADVDVMLQWTLATEINVSTSWMNESKEFFDRVNELRDANNEQIKKVRIWIAE